MTTKQEVLDMLVQKQNHITPKHKDLIENVANQFELESHKTIARFLMKNQIEYLSNQRHLEDNCRDLLLDISSGLVREFVAFGDIVGIQPLASPTSLTHILLVKQKGDVDPMDAPLSTLTIEILSTAVEAKLRKLKTTVPSEFFHDLELRNELIAVISEAVGNELIMEVIFDLLDLAKNNTTTLNHSEGLSTSDHAENVVSKLNEQANKIARLTRRGKGNFIVCSPAAANELQMFINLSKEKTLLEFKPIVVPSDSQNKKSVLNHVGNVVCTNTPTEKVVYKVLTTDCVIDINNQDTYLIGYKGVSEVDTGYVYCPYQPITSDGLTNDETTFGEVMNLSTNCAKQSRSVKLNKPSFSDSCNYYRILNVQHPQL
ncbi:hypothetical protein M0R04_07415 [Candidatus Dojkabacteria bacterium]|jgi:hypothetical protein|nr:hypothetical protein [Candidatus Dojkabacteria bacterium]